MTAPDPKQEHLDRLRQWRAGKDPDLTLGFLKDYLKREVERPRKQLQGVIEPWSRLVPKELLPKTRLETLARGVLRVVVDSSATLYELDRLLRAGLERELIRESKGPAFRKVMLRVGVVNDRKPDPKP